jgi:hypothetical protein
MKKPKAERNGAAKPPSRESRRISALIRGYKKRRNVKIDGSLPVVPATACSLHLSEVRKMLEAGMTELQIAEFKGFTLQSIKSLMAEHNFRPKGRP